MTNLTSETETKSPEWWESRPGLRLPGPGIRFSPRVRSRSREWDQNRDRTRVTETEEEEGHTHSWSDAGPEQTRGHVQHPGHHRHARPALHGWEHVVHTAQQVTSRYLFLNSNLQSGYVFLAFVGFVKARIFGNKKNPRYFDEERKYYNDNRGNGETMSKRDLMFDKLARHLHQRLATIYLAAPLVWENKTRFRTSEFRFF